MKKKAKAPAKKAIVSIEDLVVSHSDLENACTGGSCETIMIEDRTSTPGRQIRRTTFGG